MKIKYYASDLVHLLNSVRTSSATKLFINHPVIFIVNKQGHVRMHRINNRNEGKGNNENLRMLILF